MIFDRIPPAIDRPVAPRRYWPDRKGAGPDAGAGRRL